MSADNVIDGEFDTQGWNRFSYVKGNPIRLKDPTGHEGEVPEYNAYIDQYMDNFFKTEVAPAIDKVVDTVDKETRDLPGRKAITGKDPYTGKKVSTVDRVVDGAHAFFVYGLLFSRTPEVEGPPAPAGRVEPAPGGGTIPQLRAPKPSAPRGRTTGPTTDPLTSKRIGRFVGDDKGNIMIEPEGGRTVPAGPKGLDGSQTDTHTLYPNGSNYQRLNPRGHENNPTPHGHGHLEGTGAGMKRQGDSLGTNGCSVDWASDSAHWPIYSGKK